MNAPILARVSLCFSGAISSGAGGKKSFCLYYFCQRIRIFDRKISDKSQAGTCLIHFRSGQMPVLLSSEYFVDGLCGQDAFRPFEECFAVRLFEAFSVLRRNIAETILEQALKDCAFAFLFPFLFPFFSEFFCYCHGFFLLFC